MTLQQAWTQSEIDYIGAEQGYLTYAAGVSQLVDIETDFDRLELEEILGYARELMFDGLREVVRYCNPTDDRNSEKTLVKSFSLAAPIMRAMIPRVYEDNEDQLDRLHPSLYAYRPLPVLAKRVYKKRSSWSTRKSFHFDTDKTVSSHRPNGGSHHRTRG